MSFLLVFLLLVLMTWVLWTFIFCQRIFLAWKSKKDIYNLSSAEKKGKKEIFGKITKKLSSSSWWTNNVLFLVVFSHIIPFPLQFRTISPKITEGMAANLLQLYSAFLPGKYLKKKKPVILFQGKSSSHVWYN